jgi:hypothetical protein
MLLKVNFDETAFAKFKISNNFKQNIDDTQSEQPKIQRKILPLDFKSLEKKICEPKVSRLLPNVCDFRKENHTLGYGFKNL